MISVVRVVRAVPRLPAAPEPHVVLAPHAVPESPGSHAVPDALGRRGYRSEGPGRPGARVAARTRRPQRTLRFPAQPQISADLLEPGPSRGCPGLARLGLSLPARVHRTRQREPRTGAPSYRRVGPGPRRRDVVVPGSGRAGPLLHPTDPMAPAGKGGPGHPGPGGRSAAVTAGPPWNRHSASRPAASHRPACRRPASCRLPGPGRVSCGEVHRLPGPRRARRREIRHLPGTRRVYLRSGRRRPGLG